MDYIKCPYCGVKNFIDEKKCTNCSAPLIEAVLEKHNQESDKTFLNEAPTEPIFMNKNDSSANPSNIQQGMTEAQKKSLKIFLLIAGIMIFFFIIVTCIMMSNFMDAFNRFGF